MNLFETQTQPALAFPQALAEKYRPRTIDAFIGLEKPKKIASRLLSRPFDSAWLFVGSPGTGKTSLALALADEMKAELHHIPSQQCNVESIQRVRRTCQYVPAPGCTYHIVLVDEADRMSDAAQLALLSMLDATNPAPNTIFIFTCNSVDGLEKRFRERCRTVEFSSYGVSKQIADLLEKIWRQETASPDVPNFSRIVKDAGNSVRGALMSLETELICA